ncbi:MAG: tetratricopeptide repeat protein [Fimbriimonadales bacterium]|nr:tetratricopeptide repeat protein [Fimbriimonadales bacterium]
MSKSLWRIGATWVMLGVWLVFAQKPPTKPLATIGVNLKEGETISGATKVTATVQSDKMVLRVEFSVDDVLREVDESTPYEFEWDTITDAEGERRLKIVAILEGNQTVTKELKVRIDNGVDKGARHHYQQARDAFAEGKFKEAIQSARIALKADSSLKEARILLIQALLRTGRVQEADDAVEDLVRLFPDSIEGYEFRIAASLRRARTARNERELIREAINARRKVYELRLKAIGESPAPEAVAQRALLLMAQGQTESLLSDLIVLTQREDRNTRYLNLLAYAYLYAGRLRDTVVIAQTAARRGVADDYTYALRGLASGILGDERDSEAAFAEAEKVSKESRSLLAARAALAMLDRRAVSVGRWAAQAQDLSDNSPQVAFMRYWSLTLNREFDRARDAFWRTIELEPLMAEAYALRGLQNLAGGLQPGDEQLLEVARGWFELALEARPNYAPGQLGIALSYACEAYVARRDGQKPSAETLKKAEDALSKALALTRDTAWMQAGASFVLDQVGKGREADIAIQRASQLDRKRINTIRPPDPPQLIEILQALMFTPIMPPP